MLVWDLQKVSANSSPSTYTRRLLQFERGTTLDKKAAKLINKKNIAEPKKKKKLYLVNLSSWHEFFNRVMEKVVKETDGRKWPS